MDLKAWTEATGNLDWGVQQAFVDTLTLAAEGKVQIVHGTDYVDGKPCLVNSVGQMLEVGGGHGIPSANFGSVVQQFDVINRYFQNVEGYNNPNDHFVSPATAEVLLRYFGPMKDKPIDVAVDEATANEAFAQAQYREPSDADLARDWLNSIQSDAAVENSDSNEAVENRRG